ncbi:MAG: PaaI family thioesterase [Deltaproteobacteria bacterium]|nr:PaaI family thioesterase [Deltaproteobacteria bacterium]MBI3390011.1 PaaI family thioesterase [Deltaproteobacteria bacterium]
MATKKSLSAERKPGGAVASDADSLLRRRPWWTSDPSRLVGRGHPAGDFLEAYEWTVTERRKGFLRIAAHVPAHVKNPRGQLFGGFTPTYVDMVALMTVRAGEEPGSPRHWLATTNMRIDYFEPVVGPRFVIESELIKARGRLRFVQTRFLDEAATLLVFAVTTMREVDLTRKLGDV